MSQEKKNILRKLMHEPILSFNKLWEKKGSSNGFAYHLKSLEQEGFIKKTSKGYGLTHEGKKFAAYIDGETGEQSKFPVMGVLVVVYNKREDKVLMLHRLKEPFYGYWGFIAGKIKFSQYILECACAELKEEAGISCDLELKGLFSSKTMQNGKLAFNHQLFIVKGTNPRGKLIKKTREGECSWISIEKISKLNSFPNVQESIRISSSKNFVWVEADRLTENDKFIEMNVLREEEF